jgi:hypothetical protein
MTSLFPPPALVVAISRGAIRQPAYVAKVFSTPKRLKIKPFRANQEEKVLLLMEGGFDRGNLLRCLLSI